jgi:hypothetical protein
VRSQEAESEVGAGRLPITVVTLACPGFTVRAAERPVSVEDALGDGPYFYDARLTGCAGFEPEVSLFDHERGEISRARISLVLPEDQVPAEVEMLWHWLTAAKVEVAQIWSGQAWKDRVVRLGGATVSNLKLGVAGEPIEFVAEAAPQAVGDYVGDPSRDMGDVGQMLGFTQLDGKEFPTIIGRCYRLPAFKVGQSIGGTLGTSELLFAGHRFASVAAVTLYENSNDTAFAPAGTVTVTNGTDALGDEVCYAVSTSSTDFAAGAGAFTFDAENGGVRAVRGTGAAVRADGVLASLLTTAGGEIDWKRTQPCLDKLTGWEVGVYLDRAREGLKVIRDRLVPYLPIIEEQGEDGIWFRYSDVFHDPPEVDLVAGQNLVGRTTGLEQITDPDEIRNALTLKYFYDHYTGEYLRSVTVNHTNNAMCALSRQHYGVRAANTVSCNVTWDDATATRMAHNMINRRALHRFAIGYIPDPSLYWLREGTIARLYDASMGITSFRRCVVRKINAKQNPPRIRIELMPGTSTSLGA